MAFSFSEYKKGLADAAEWLKRELAGVRTGQATPALLDGVKVEAYGQPMPLNQVASVTVEDSRSLRISPWDQGNTKVIERAIQDANLGVSVGADESGVRVSFPELTGERREQLRKLVKSKLEDARVTVRAERDRVRGDIQKKEKDGELSEDEKFRAMDEMEKLTKEANEKLEAIALQKEKEISL